MSQAGVAKLNEAKALVAELNSKAGEQSRELAVKQKEADDALKKIQTSMEVKISGKGHFWNKNEICYNLEENSFSQNAVQTLKW